MELWSTAASMMFSYFPLRYVIMFFYVRKKFSFIYFRYRCVF